MFFWYWQAWNLQGPISVTVDNVDAALGLKGFFCYNKNWNGKKYLSNYGKTFCAIWKPLGVQPLYIMLMLLLACFFIIAKIEMAKNVHLWMRQIFSTFKIEKLVFDLQMGQILQFKIFLIDFTDGWSYNMEFRNHG